MQITDQTAYSPTISAMKVATWLKLTVLDWEHYSHSERLDWVLFAMARLEENDVFELPSHYSNNYRPRVCRLVSVSK